MNLATPVNDPLRFSFHEIILQQGELISDKLNMLRFEHYPPNAAKGLRSFSLSEVAYFLDVTPSNIKKLHLEGKGPAPTTSVSGRRTYSAEQMFELRQYLDRHGRSDFKKYVPHRRGSEPLQVISVVNFKGGSGKTTTACHLAQHLALTGHRVLSTKRYATTTARSGFRKSSGARTFRVSTSSRRILSCRNTNTKPPWPP
jgi:chromosome partitioning protein